MPVRRKIGRTPKAENTKARLIEAAFDVVSRFGYGKASVARITRKARVSHGTFYNYFVCRQDVFDLLPSLYAERMFDFIRPRMPADARGVDREVARFEAYLAFIADNSWGGRLIYEAATFAPRGYNRYIARIRDSYMRTLRRAVAAGDMSPLPEDQLVIVVEMLMSIREGIARLYVNDGRDHGSIPPVILETYRMAMSRLLFGGEVSLKKPHGRGRKELTL